MKTIVKSVQMWCPRKTCFVPVPVQCGLRQGLVLAIIAAWPSSALADPPVVPLPTPWFSFARSSQQVADGVVGADEILGLGTPDVQTVFMGWSFGLGLAADDLDAHSLGNSTFASGTIFALLFSVDLNTVGTSPPVPELVALEVPYNVFDQARRGQAGGDQFLATAIFTVDTLVMSEWPNNVLLRNNFDEGGTDFDALPESSAEDDVVGQPQDRVNATTHVPSPMDVIYFSVAADSPSLTGLHGQTPPSGADIFVFTPPAVVTVTGSQSAALRGEGAQLSGPPCQVACSHQASDVYDTCIAQGGSVETCAAQAHEVLATCLQTQCGIVAPQPPGLYAAATELGLVQADDIDALIVFDTDGDGMFNGTDRVLFSLAPDSPSLDTIPGVSASGAAADVFRVSAVDSLPTLFAPAEALGLGNEVDNIDALDLIPCGDVIACATAHGIRSHQVVPAVSTWGAVVVALLILTTGTVLAQMRGAHTDAKT